MLKGVKQCHYLLAEHRHNNRGSIAPAPLAVNLTILSTNQPNLEELKVRTLDDIFRFHIHDNIEWPTFHPGTLIL